MNAESLLTTASNKLEEPVEFEGLLLKTGRLAARAVADAQKVLGFDYLVEHEDTCYTFYSANPPLVGMTQPTVSECPVGLAIFDEYKIDYKGAIEIFHTGDWGDSFTLIDLSKPLTPQIDEPLWHFISDLGVDILIGANSGKIISPE